MNPPLWTYVLLGLVGIVQILVSVLIGVLLSRLKGMKIDIKDFKKDISELSTKLEGFVLSLQCKERRKKIENDMKVLWEEFKNHKHMNGEVIR